MQDYDLILVDHSCGGNNGSAISRGEAVALASLGRPLILFGEAHGVIDGLANYTGGMGQISASSIVQKASGMFDHPIYSSPYLISEAGFGVPGSIEIFSHVVSLESYPDHTINCLYSLSCMEGCARPVIGALYSAQGIGGRILWWAFKDPSMLNANGCHLFINTVEWMGGLTDLRLILNFLAGDESLDPSKSTYWTAGYADYFEPQVAPTYYAYESLRLAGRISAINSSALADWLTAYCYSPSQGFFHSPNMYLSPIQWSGIAETGMSIKILSELGRMNQVNSSKTSIYIGSCQLTDGFVRYPGDSAKSLTNTYWALMGLNATGAFTRIDTAKAVDYVLSCQNLNPLDTANYGGFANHPGAVSSAMCTFMALACLELLNGAGSADLNLTEQWLMKGYDPLRGVFYDDHLFNERYSVNYGTGYSVASLSMIGKLADIDESRVARYLLSAQFGDGGWSGANCTDEPIDEVVDCYPVILGLQRLDQIAAIRSLDGFVGFITRCLCPAPTYGFANVPHTLSNIWHTCDATSILNNLGAIEPSSSSSLTAFIISTYDSAHVTFEWSRYSYPQSSDLYGYENLDPPYEFTSLQRGKRGVIIDDLALQSLMDLDAKTWLNIHAQELWNQITLCEIITGSAAGYYKDMPSDSVSNLTAGLQYTYHALNCLFELAGFLGYSNSFPSHLPNATMTVNKIMNLYKPSVGSFAGDSYILGPYSATETTSIALMTLKLLNGLSGVDYGRTTEFLQSYLYSNLVDTYYSFKGLEALNKLSTINATRLVEFIRSSQKPNGAFKSDGSALYELDTTRMAIEILSHYNSTWITARPIRLVASNLEAPATMHQGSSYSVNCTVLDDHFMLPVAYATLMLRLGTYEYSAIETTLGAGHYSARVAVARDVEILGTQNLVIKCSEGTYQTSFAQTRVEVLLGEGGANNTHTQISFTQPADGEYLTTSNTSVAVLICALNKSETPIQGLQIAFCANNSFVENSASDSRGLATFSWRPHSSGVYILKAVFEGSSGLDSSEAEKAITVDKTPTQLSVYSNCTALERVDTGHTVQFSTRLTEVSCGKQVANASVDFVVFDPLGTIIDVPATTSVDGEALVLFTVKENGSYSVHTVFGSTNFYLGCTSNEIVLKVGSSSPHDGGGGPTGDDQGVTWINSLLGALSTPLGIGLITSSGGLITTAYLLRTKRRNLESSDTQNNERRASNDARTRESS